MEKIIILVKNKKKNYMKGKKGIAIFLASIALAGGIIFGISKYNNSNKQPKEPVEMVTYIDEEGKEQQIEKNIYMTLEPNEFEGEFYIKVNPDDYDKYGEDYLYEIVYCLEEEEHINDGYDENDPLDVIAICNPTELTYQYFNTNIITDEVKSLKTTEDYFEIVDGKLRPKNGLFTYFVTNTVTIKVEFTFNPSSNKYEIDKNISNAEVMGDVNEYLESSGMITK